MLSGGVLLGSQIGGAEPSNDGFSYARYWDGSNFAWTSTPIFGIGTTLTPDGTDWIARFTDIGSNAHVSVQTQGTNLYDAGIALGDEGNQWKTGVWSYANGNGEIWNGSEKILFETSTDSIQFQTAGANERMRIDSSGNVGIGATTLSAPLHVVGTGGQLASPITGVNSFYIENLGSNVNLVHGIDTGRYANWQAYRSGGAQAFGVHRWEESTGDFIIRTGDGTSTIADRWRVKNDGTIIHGDDTNKCEVGINLSSPDSSGLHIRAAASTTAATANGASFPLVIQKDDNVVLGIFTGATYESRIQFGDIAANTGRVARIAVPVSSGDMYFETGGGLSTNSTEKVRITSGGLVGIGTSSPGFNIQIYEATKTKGPKISFINVNTGTTTGDGFEVGLSSSSEDALVWHRENNPIRFATNNSERARFGASGGFLLKEIADAEADVAGFGQIWVDNTAPNRLYFTDDTGVDQALSNYRGSWTPSIVDSSFNLSESQTYTNQYGFYYIMGKMCYLYFDITINSLGTLTTTDPCYLVGLPFTCIDANVPATVAYGSSLAQSGSFSSVSCLIQNGTYANFWLWDTSAGTTTMTIAELSAGGRLLGSAIYPVTS